MPIRKIALTGGIATGKSYVANQLKEAGVPMVGWGQFLTAFVNFLILAFIIFLLVRAANRATGKKDEAAGPTEVDLLTEIRDELKRR